MSPSLAALMDAFGSDDFEVAQTVADVLLGARERGRFAAGLLDPVVLVGGDPPDRQVVHRAIVFDRNLAATSGIGKARRVGLSGADASLAAIAG
jgi:hypothetical protein